MGFSKKGAQREWVEYYISMHLGFCHGPVDTLMGVYMKERPAWEGWSDDNERITVNRRNLFGGDEREGGVAGAIEHMTGKATQLIPSSLGSRIGLDPENAPGFRGILSLFLHGGGISGRKGFLVAANYPQVPKVWARVRRSPKTQLSAATAIIAYETPQEEIDAFLADQADGQEEDEDIMNITDPDWYIRHDANPAHIIFECLVNSEWGMGGSPNMIDVQSFEEAAQTLYDEKFGLSVKWTRSSTVEAFISEIIDHIKAVLFFHPRTGLATIRLLRDDYDPDSLRGIGESNCKLLSFRRKLWGETTNEIVVQWTNPFTEQSETISHQDIANIAMQGGLVSETRNYYGIRNRELASKVCARDLREAAIPMATAKVRVMRSEWDLILGEPVQFSYPSKGVERLIMRVMNIDYGKPGDEWLTCTLVEDVWGLPEADFVTPPPPTEWRDPSLNPNNATMESRFFAVPYPLISRYLGDNVSDDDYPEIIVAALATRDPEQEDVQAFILNGEATLDNGDPTWQSLGEMNFTPYTSLGTFLPQEAHSTILLGDIDGDAPTVGSFGILWAEDGLENEMEIVMFDAQDSGSGAWQIARGIYDTVPRNWSAGTRLYIIGSTYDSVDAVSRLANATIRYKMQARTSLGIGSLDSAPVLTTQHVERPYLPFRPANLKVENVAFGALDESNNYEPRDWTIDISWSRRNRLMEDSVVRRWDEADVLPEDGQTTDLIITYIGGGTETVERVTGLTGTSYTIQVENTGQIERLKIKAVAMRDGLESFTGHEITVQLYKKGYGSDWSHFFGGWPEQPGE